MRSDRRGFSLLEIIVAIAVMSILAAAIVPLAFRQIDQARFTRMSQDLQAIYEAPMGSPSENYFGYVGDVGGLRTRSRNCWTVSAWARARTAPTCPAAPASARATSTATPTWWTPSRSGCAVSGPMGGQ